MKFRRILLLAGFWNLFISSWALFFKDHFLASLELLRVSESFTIFWLFVFCIGISWIITAFNHSKLRIGIIIGIPGKVIAFIPSIILFITEQANIRILLIGFGDLLFIIPFYMFLKETKRAT
ncbi:MAG: hypothetical protein CMD53_00220 [Gammaproteobacteria bacterium]|jgi:hypothetical protein|nr:hypothetical protein [Gammaproteobacteria bacterium]HJL96244.1 hypothetical protein [SAR86 cluster bacterium]|tara:strand:- start:1217 stop:1582 length:366 start_codon:yes stop_codon:yes gene_type:complete